MKKGLFRNGGLCILPCSACQQGSIQQDRDIASPWEGHFPPRRCWVVVTFAPLLQPARPKHRCSWAKMVRKFQVFLLAPGNTSYGAPQRLQHKQDPQPQRRICSIWARNVQVPASFLKMWSHLGYVDHTSGSGGLLCIFHCSPFSTVQEDEEGVCCSLQWLL